MRILRRKKRAALPPVVKAGARVREHRLRNGMRVLLAERRGDPVVAVVLFYRVGARNETEPEAGVSHFLEHMMFKGTPRFGKGVVDRITTQLGGQNNAFTGYDHTAYWFEFASDRWVQALDLEADRMRNLLLDPVEFAAEREVVLEELAMGEDDPWRVLARHVEEKLFPRHPYGRPIIGYEDALRALSPDDLRDYYERFYHPGNATLVVAGDVTPSRALAEVRSRFGGLEAGVPYDAADCFRPRLEEPAGPVSLVTRWDDEARRVVMAWRTTRVGTPDDYALDLALGVLAGGRMSRLQRRLVYDDRIATSVSASNDTRVDSGAFWLFAECAQDVVPEVLEKIVDEEFARLSEEKVSREELRRAKGMVRASEAFDGETVSDLAEELGEWAVDADWRMTFDGGERHRRVTAEGLRRAVATHLIPERRVTGWCLPNREQRSAVAESSPVRGRGSKKRAAAKGRRGGSR